MQLDRRALNRALLARQHLLDRVDLAPLDLINHLVGLQSQAPNPPYVGLWSRLRRFAPDELSSLLEQRRVARIALMRSTIHLVSAQDALALRPAMQSVHTRALSGTWKRLLAGVDRVALGVRARELCTEQPRTFAELGNLLAAEFDAQPHPLAVCARVQVPLVQVPPRGLWRRTGPAAHQPSELWFGEPEPSTFDLGALVLRYLAAFGPAAPADFTVWSGITGARAAFASVREQLVAFADDEGRELFDLPDAPRPGADSVAPVRLIAEWDNLLLSHADRVRIIDPAYKKVVYTVNGVMPGTLLMDGFVAGIYRVRTAGGSATVVVQPFSSLGPRQRSAVEREALTLLDFVAPGAGHAVVFE